MSSFCTAKATHIFFSKKFQYICVSLDLNFNESLTNDVVSFEQLGPVSYILNDNVTPAVTESCWTSHVVQSIVSFTSSLVVKMFTVLVSTISYS